MTTAHVYEIDNPAKFMKYPLAALKTPGDGDIVYADRYWVVTPDDHVLFYSGCSPQCNSHIEVMDTMMRRYPTCRMEKIPAAFVPAIYLR